MFEGQSHWSKFAVTNVPHRAIDARYENGIFVVVCRVLCTKVIGVTSTESFLELNCYSWR